MNPQSLADAVHALMPRTRSDLAELVAFESVADVPALAGECAAAAAWIAGAMTAQGFGDVMLLDTPDGTQAVWGELPAAQGAPVVLLYAHYDVQPAADRGAWATDPFRLTEAGGRWYGRGAADCKGSVLMHLTALRALAAVGDGRLPDVHVKFIVEGSEEQGTGGLERYAESHPELLAADVVVIADTANVALDVPTLTTSLRGMTTVEVHTRTLAANAHSGSFGGGAPDALAALVRLLDSLYDEDGHTRIDGLERSQTWRGSPYPVEKFRADAEVLPSVELPGTAALADLLWARPAVTVVGIDCPAVQGATSAVQARARALVSLRVPPGTGAARAQEALAAHLEAAAPRSAEVTVERLGVWEAFETGSDGPAHRTMLGSLRDVFATEPARCGQGGSIPVCVTLAGLYPDAEFLLLGVQDPASRIHSTDESVDPGLLARMATAEALFLHRLAAPPA